MSVETLVAAPVTLPRVNLLPQEVNEANAARRVKFGLAGALVVVVAGVGYMYMSAGSSVDSAQAELETAQSGTAALTRELASHQAITPLKTEVEGRTQLLASAMALNVPWASYMGDVQVGLPRGARLMSWNMQLNPQLVTPTAVFGGNGVASWTVTGQAKRYEDVALVIESLTRLPQVDSVEATSAAYVRDTDSGQMVVEWSATARMNAGAVAPYDIFKKGS